MYTECPLARLLSLQIIDIIPADLLLCTVHAAAFCCNWLLFTDTEEEVRCSALGRKRRRASTRVLRHGEEIQEQWQGQPMRAATELH